MSLAGAGVPFDAGYLVAFGCAELFTFLMRNREITLLIKNNAQRTQSERQEVGRGLLRSVMLECAVFVPASVLLMLVVIRPLVANTAWFGILASGPGSQAFYGVLGILSYQFPFAAVRRVSMRMVLHTLQTFANIALKDEGLAIASDPAASRKGSPE